MAAAHTEAGKPEDRPERVMSSSVGYTVCEYPPRLHSLLFSTVLGQIEGSLANVGERDFVSMTRFFHNSLGPPMIVPSSVCSHKAMADPRQSLLYRLQKPEGTDVNWPDQSGSPFSALPGTDAPLNDRHLGVRDPRCHKLPMPPASANDHSFGSTTIAIL